MPVVAPVSFVMPVGRTVHVRSVWCLVLLVVAPWCGAVENGGFERWSSTGPEGWLRTPGTLPAAAVVRASGTVLEGSFAVIISTAYSSTRNTGIFQDVGVEPGASYTVSAWVMALSNPLRREVGIGIRPGGGGMYNVALHPANHAAVTEAETWRRVVLSTQVPDGVTTLGISAFVRVGGTDTLTAAVFDDVRCERDAVPPAAVNDLSAAPAGDGVSLAWTAPGNDGTVGVLLPGSAFIVALSSTGAPGESPGTPGCLHVVVSTAGVAPGSSRRFLMEGLSPDATWYARIWTRDNTGNLSAPSNVADTAVHVVPDTIAPAAVDDLRVVAWDTSGAVTLAWTVPGDDGTVGVIENGTLFIRCSSRAVADHGWSTATAAVALSTGGVPPGAPTALTMVLWQNATWWFTLRYRDASGNLSGTSNVIALFVEPPPMVAVRLTEINYDDDIGDAGCEWVEFINRSSHAVDVSRWRARSSGMSGARNIAPEPGWGDIRSLPPGAVAVICEAPGRAGDFAVRFGPASPDRFLGRIAGDWALSNSGGWVRLADEWDRVLAETAYTGTVANRSIVPVSLEADPADPAFWAPGAPGGTPFVADVAAPPPSGDAAWPGAVLINEVLYDAVGADTGREWVELVNCATRPFALNGWRIQKTTGPADSSAVWTDVAVATGGVLAPSGWFLCAQSSAAAVFGADLIIPDSRTLNNSGPCAIRLLDASGMELDRLAYGGTASDALAEGGRAAGSCGRDAGETLARRPQGYDTDDNAADWVVCREPSPRTAAWVDTESPSPAQVVNAEPGNRGITVRWDWGTSDDVRRAELAADAPGWSTATVCAWPRTSWRLEPVRNRSRYEVSVVLVDRSGNRSAARTAWCEPSIAPPTRVSAACGDGGVLLRWIHSVDMSAPNFAGYRVYRGAPDAGATLSPVGDTLGAEWRDTTADTAAAYRFRVHTVEDDGTESAVGAECIASPDILPPVFVSVRPEVQRTRAVFTVEVHDDRWTPGDGAGLLAGVWGWWRMPGGVSVHPLTWTPPVEPAAAMFTGTAVAEEDFSRGVEARLEASDGVRTVCWPPDGWFRWIPADAPSRALVTPRTPEVVFGDEVRSVVVRDPSGRTVWSAVRETGGDRIVWRACDRGGTRVESGAYRTECTLNDGRRTYGVVVVIR